MEKRIIERNEPFFPVYTHTDENKEVSYSVPVGSTVLLEIAAKFMAAHIEGCAQSDRLYKSAEVAEQSLKDAQALLTAYNELP